MNTRILNALKQTTLIEEKQKASHCFVEDMPPYAINQELSLKEHGRVLRNYFFKKANYKFNPNKPGIFQWQSVDDVFLMVVD